MVFTLMSSGMRLHDLSSPSRMDTFNNPPYHIENQGIPWLELEVGSIPSLESLYSDRDDLYVLGCLCFYESRKVNYSLYEQQVMLKATGANIHKIRNYLSIIVGYLHHGIEPRKIKEYQEKIFDLTGIPVQKLYVWEMRERKGRTKKVQGGLFLLHDPGRGLLFNHEWWVCSGNSFYAISYNLEAPDQAGDVFSLLRGSWQNFPSLIIRF